MLLNGQDNLILTMELINKFSLNVKKNQFVTITIIIISPLEFYINSSVKVPLEQKRTNRQQ